MSITGGDHVQLVDGSAFTGSVTNETFSIRLNFMPDPLVVDRRRVVWIIRKNGKSFDQDRMLLSEGSELRGEVTDEYVLLKSGDAGTQKIPMKAVLALQLLLEFG